MTDPAPIYAELADLTIDIAREIRLRGHAPLAPTQSQVMRYLHAHPGSTPSQIASGTGLRRGNVSPALTQLREMGYVEAREDPDDARSVRVTATPLADRTLAQLQASWSELLAQTWPEGADPHEVAGPLRALLTGLAATRGQPDET